LVAAFGPGQWRCCWGTQGEFDGHITKRREFSSWKFLAKVVAYMSDSSQHSQLTKKISGSLPKYNEQQSAHAENRSPQKESTSLQSIHFQWFRYFWGVYHTSNRFQNFGLKTLGNP